MTSYPQLSILDGTKEVVDLNRAVREGGHLSVQPDLPRQILPLGVMIQDGQSV